MSFALIGVPGDNKAIILKYGSDEPNPQWDIHESLFPPPGMTEFGYSIDLNGITNVDDMLVVISNWGSCR